METRKTRKKESVGTILFGTKDAGLTAPSEFIRWSGDFHYQHANDEHPRRALLGGVHGWSLWPRQHVVSAGDSCGSALWAIFPHARKAGQQGARRRMEITRSTEQSSVGAWRTVRVVSGNHCFHRAELGGEPAKQILCRTVLSLGSVRHGRVGVERARGGLRTVVVSEKNEKGNRTPRSIYS